VLEELAVLEALVGLAAINGSTTRNIGAVLPMETVLRQTDLVARLGETLWEIVRPVRETRSAARAVMWAPTAAGQAASVELAGLEARVAAEELAALVV
jgi:hypothetical protein